ncbi:hypothetical protein FH972_024276 [Carpinus fangiana]|uniref:Uncharacterized protein n=1 Tax=Carpinus fangiana TaxID=176857 RepID=A0A5N6KXL4_9ROSI|nr:hypothetical protein FH972_024276 [Carpinus fangiana]
MPLGGVTEAHRRRLCKALWSWAFCDACEQDQACIGTACPAERLRHLKTFFNHFEETIATYDAVESVSRQATLKSLDNLLGALERLKTSSHMTRQQAIPTVFQLQQKQLAQEDARKELALNMVVEIAFLVTCAGQRHSLSALERGMHSAPWKSDDTFITFIIDSFPQAEEQSERKGGNAVDFEGCLTAYHLRKEAKLRFQPTNDLRNHLKLDRKSGVLEIFHHAAFLKEQLRLSKTLPADCLLTESLARCVSLRCHGDSTDLPKEEHFRGNFDFDRDCLRFEWTAIRHNTEKDMSYNYWLERLEILRDEVENPRPQGFVELWLERRSAPRYVMLATLIGVVIAVLLGAAALGISAYQTYVAYNAWKYPVAPPTA